jgi:rhodanese-related sulfurtransferase
MNERVDLPQAREVCPTTTRRLLGEGALLVDVRERAEVGRLAFNVPGLVNLPLSEFEQGFAQLPRDRALVLACQSGPRSLKATYFLMYQGYTQVANLEGGIVKWTIKGFPVIGQRAEAGSTGACATGECGPDCVPDAGGSCCAPAESVSTSRNSCCG